MSGMGQKGQATGPYWLGRSARGKKIKLFQSCNFAKGSHLAHMFNHSWWRLAVGDWWQLAVGS